MEPILTSLISDLNYKSFSGKTCGELVREETDGRDMVQKKRKDT